MDSIQKWNLSPVKFFRDRFIGTQHTPYVLLSLLCALHEGQWTIDEVQGTLQMLFDRQYILTEDVVVETRYRTETDTWTDADGNSHTDTYQVPYDYYILYGHAGEL